MADYDVVVFGTVNPDIIVYPLRGLKQVHTRMISFKRKIRSAGPGAHGAIALSRLGLKCCSIDAVGPDIFGRFIVDELKRFGVDTEHMKGYSGEEMFTIWIVDERGEGKTMIAAPPSKPIFASFDEAMSFFEKIPKGKMIYLGHWFWPYLNLFSEPRGKPSHKILHLAKERGFSIVLDINYNVWMEKRPPKNEVRELKKSLKYVDVLVPNLLDARILVGSKSPKESSQSLLKLGPEIIGLKMGNKGCYVASKEESVYIPSLKVKVKDTIGAGDIFGSAFAYGWLKGWKPKKIGTFANAAAAFFISHENLYEKFPTPNQVHDFLKKEKFNV